MIEPPRPDPLRLVIVGGGTAGWMAANLLAARWPAGTVTVTLVEAPDVATIGVGEGSTPSLKRMFEVLGITEAEWMPRCHATYKASIRFAGWSPATGIADYSHPFLTQLDIHTEPAFLRNCGNRRLGFEVPTDPAAFLLNGRLAAEGKAPVAPANFPFRMEYGYHFDSGLLGEFLREAAIARGVVHVARHVSGVELGADGDIAALATREGERIAGDWFFDCTGFAALLMEGALGVPFVSFKDNLFNDAAVVLPTPPTARLPVETTATALAAGWTWAIPLTHRVGNGYVYSRDFLAPEQAEAELRGHLGLGGDTPARHLTFKVGRLARTWERNCIAIGLAQGFIEPLEATALHLVLNTIELFAGRFEEGGFGTRNRDAFNREIAERIERVRDYIVAHYKLNTRDGAYWEANRTNDAVSPQLEEVLGCWFRRADLAALLEARQDLSHFNTASWHCLLAGYGAFPALTAEQRDDVDFHRDHAIAPFLAGCALNFPDHAAALAALAGAGR